MITASSLQALATKHQVLLINIYREYVQHVFLSSLYQQDRADAFYFKGGTALKLVYHSPRYSEDLDFSLGLISFSAIERTILSVLEQIKTMGFKPEIIESKETSGGYLGKFRVYIYGEEVPISIQGSRRIKKGLEGEVELVANDFIPSYSVQLLAQPLLVGEKIEAALTRGKPRDFFDVYFLSRSGMLPLGKRKELGELIVMLKKNKIDFTAELKRFLPASFHSLIKNFPDAFAREIRKYP